MLKHLDSRESKLQRPCLNVTPQFSKLFVVSSQTLFEVCEFLALLLLDSQRNLASSLLSAPKPFSKSASFLPFSFWTANAIWQALCCQLPNPFRSLRVSCPSPSGQPTQFGNTCQGNYLLFGSLPLCIHVLSSPVIQFSHRQETVLTHHHALCCGSKRWKQPRILSQLYHQ